MQLQRSMFVFVWGIALSSGLVGCDGGGDKLNKGARPQTFSAKAMSIAEVCELRVSQAQNADKCIQGNVGSAETLSDTVLATMCRAGTDDWTWAADLIASAEAERVSINWSTARKCLSKSRELRGSVPGYTLYESEEWAEVEMGECTTFYHGAADDDQFCKEDWDCLQDGSFCYSDAPTEAGSTHCLKPAPAGQPCSDFHPCDELSYCDMAGLCIAKFAAGVACDPDLWGDDCLSALCDDMTTTCSEVEEAPALKAIGEACDTVEECDGECVGCRSLVHLGVKTCQRLGGTGEYCESWLDCVNDLGCTARECSALAENEACGFALEAMCAPELACVPADIHCFEFGADEEACSADETCMFDPNNGVCVYGLGTCATLPTEGPCVSGFFCAAGTFCEPTTTTCVPLATVGQACSADGTTAPPCDDQTGAYCIEGTCVRPCEYNEDCPKDTYCNFDLDVPACAARNAACTSSAACNTGNYCELPSTETCSGHADRSSCEADSVCSFVEDGFCSTVEDLCTPHSADRTACETAGCSYDTEFEECYAPVSCWEASSHDDCSAVPGCAWEVSEYCSGAPDLTGSCKPLLDAGEECTSYEACISGDCQEQERGPALCAVALSGCERDSASVRLTFLFGLVWAVGHRSRSRSRRSRNSESPRSP